MTEAIALHDILADGLPDRAAVLADLDGCLISGDTVLADVPELFARLRHRLWIVSNNSCATAISLSARLARLGLDLAPGRIFLAGERTLRRIAAERPGARIALYAAAPLQALAKELGLHLDRARPDIAMLARDPDFTFSDLSELTAHLHRGVQLWLSNLDASHPGPDGTPQPETGALFAAVAAIVPGAAYRQLGKPDPYLLDLALAAAGARPDQAIFLGDTEATDGEAARAAGMPFVLLARPTGAARPAMAGVA
jgi:HAD superfamily hydrolase (TIGR01450 family)